MDGVALGPLPQTWRGLTLKVSVADRWRPLIAVSLGTSLCEGETGVLMTSWVLVLWKLEREEGRTV